MPIPIRCPECAAVATVPDTLAGKTVRCKSCQATFPVVAPAPARVAGKPVRAAVMATENDSAEQTPLPRTRAATGTIAAPKPKSKLPLILGGVFGLLVCAGIGAAAVLALKGGPTDSPVLPGQNTPEVAQNTVAPPAPPQPEATPFTAPTPATPPALTPAAATPIESESAPSVVRPMVRPPEVKPTAGTTTTGLPPPEKLRPSDIEMARAKEAAVYIECESVGGTASGSGWFGVEENLIVTNAHVVDMMGPNSPKPKKLTVWVNPGTPKQRKIPHERLDVVIADRFADLAIIRVINEKNLPVPLKIRPSLTLREIEPLIVIGYPGGRLTARINQSKGPPQATVNTTSFSTNYSDGDGNFYAVQIRGGAGPGNSGGPIIDMNGDVVAVLVRGPTDSTFAASINYGVPTEMVQGLFAGRLGDIEYGQAVRKNGKVHVPVKATVLDPFQRLNQAGVAIWIADKDSKRRPPGNKRTGQEEADANYQEVKLDYKWAKDKQVATGELVYPEAPAGRTYWTQPYYSSALVSKAFQVGSALKMSGPPVDPEEIDLVARLRPGTTRQVTITSSSALDEFEEGEATDFQDRIVLDIEVTAKEQVRSVTTNNSGFVARLQQRFETVKLKVEQGEDKVDILAKAFPKEMLAVLSEAVKQIQGIADVGKSGEILQSKPDLRGLGQYPKQLVELLKRFSDSTMEAVQQASVPLPNGKLTSGQTWNGNDQTIRFTLLFVGPGGSGGDSPPPGDGPGDENSAPLQQPGPRGPRGGPQGQPRPPRTLEYIYLEQRTYTYHGTRTRNGVKEAVIGISGAIKQAPGATSVRAANGKLTGHAYIDLDTGTVLESELHREFELDTSTDGQKKSVAGISNYKIVRGSVQGQ